MEISLLKLMVSLFQHMFRLEMVYSYHQLQVALSKGCSVICYGAHSDDVAGAAYPDCSKEFNDAINSAIYIGSGKELRVEAPFVNMTKADIVKEGLELGVPYELTWSCYEGGEEPCGQFGTCIDREKAFEENGVKDPLLK